MVAEQRSEGELPRLGAAEEIVGQDECPAAADGHPCKSAKKRPNRQPSQVGIRRRRLGVKRTRSREQDAGVGAGARKDGNCAETHNPAKLSARVREGEHASAHHLAHHHQCCLLPAGPPDRETVVGTGGHGRARGR
eukprot:scaffold263_cov120-Isochrysis_galbana.AAC.19